MRATSPVPVQFVLRSFHRDFLKDLARQSDAKVSRTFARIVAAARGRPEFRQERPTKIERLHLNLAADDLEFLEGLTRLWGVSRSIAAQRLIELAQEGRLPMEAPAEGDAPSA